MQPQVSIILVNYNTRQMTYECIDSIRSHTHGVSYEIILVDNASTDGSADFFAQTPGITFIASDENLGFGRANNLGFRQAQGEVLFLLNTDTVLHNDAVTLLYRWLEHADASVACVGALLMGRDGRPTHSYGIFPGTRYFLNRLAVLWFPRLMAHWDAPQTGHTFPRQVDYITGADVMLRRSVAERYGLFDPEFFLYLEETEMQHRYRTHGLQSWVIDTPRITHLQGSSTTAHSGGTFRAFTRDLTSTFIYCRKVFSPLRQHLYWLLHLLMIPRILLCRVPWSQRRQAIRIIWHRRS